MTNYRNIDIRCRAETEATLSRKTSMNESPLAPPGKGHHKSHKSSHKKAEGHKGDKGHHEKKGHKKIHKGNYDKKHKTGKGIVKRNNRPYYNSIVLPRYCFLAMIRTQL